MSGQRLMPERIGDYRLLNRIGEGGMGVVYRAEDAAGRSVALKVLREAVAGEPMARRRLAREVETMQRVKSPYVAEVIDADIHGDTPYIVTRYVPGQTMDEVVTAHGPLTGAMLARVAFGLAEALAAVHAAGVVHRDLKPGNVMLLDGSPVVIDFGIAQGADATRLTLTGMFMGTPGYLAPEVIEGNPSSEASDVHAWGATVAFAATGRPPYGKGTYESIFYRIVNGRADLSGCPVPLVPLLVSALSRDPAQRPPAVQLCVRTAALDAAALVPGPVSADAAAGGESSAAGSAGAALTRADAAGERPVPPADGSPAGQPLAPSPAPIAPAPIAPAPTGAPAPSAAASAAAAAFPPGDGQDASMAGGGAGAGTGRAGGGAAGSGLAGSSAAAGRVSGNGAPGAGAAAAGNGAAGIGAPGQGAAGFAGPGQGAAGFAGPGQGAANIGAAGHGPAVDGAAADAVAPTAFVAGGNGVPGGNPPPVSNGYSPTSVLPPGTRPLPIGVPSAAELRDMLPPVRYGAPGTPGGPPENGPRQAAGARPARDTGYVPRRPHGTRLLTAATVVALAAVSVLLPVAGTVAVLSLLTLLRAAGHAQRRSAARRAARGARATDAVVLTLTFPLQLLRSLLTLVLLAPFALAVAAVAAGVTVASVPADWPQRALAYAAGAGVLFYGLGPGSGTIRRELGQVFRTVTRWPAANVVVLAGMGVLMVAAVSTALSWPSFYWPVHVGDWSLNGSWLHWAHLNNLGVLRRVSLTHPLRLLGHALRHRWGR